MHTQNRSRTIFIVLVLFIATVAGVIFVSVRRGVPEGQVDIVNLSDCAPDINSVIYSQIRTNMYVYVERGNDYNQRQNLPGYTAEIRQGSCNTETTNSADGIFRSNAVLDIPEARQSWAITFSWTSAKGNPKIDLGTVEPECLPASQLRYGDFKCQNVLSLVNYGTDKYDPILKHMPYDGDSFNLLYDPETKTISATVLVPPREADNPALITNTEAAVPLWLQQKGLDPNNYTIRYRVAAKQD